MRRSCWPAGSVSGGLFRYRGIPGWRSVDNLTDYAACAVYLPSTPGGNLPVTDPIRILIADDHDLVRTAIASVLAEEPDFQVVGQASNGMEAITKTQRFRPDVIVMDLEMPRVDGTDATRLIRGTWPNVRVVGLSVCDRDDVVQRMKDAGVSAYVTKSSPMSELIRAVRDAARIKT